MEIIERIVRFQGRKDEKRKRSQDTFLGHCWWSTWHTTEVAQIRQVELLGGQDRGLDANPSFRFT